MAITTAAPDELTPASPVREDKDIHRARTLALVLDNFLVDPLIGALAPGVGDVIGSLLGMYTVMLAVRRKVSPVIIARMLLNLGIDMVVGVVPIVGDALDFGWKANRKNAELLAERHATGGRATARDWAFVGAAALLYVAIMVGVIWGVTALIRHIHW